MDTPTPALVYPDGGVVGATPNLPRLALNETEAGRMVGYSRRGLQNLRLRGGGPAYIQIGRNIRYRIEDLEAWLDAQTRRTSTSDSGKAA